MWWLFRSKVEGAEVDVDVPPSPEVTPTPVENRLLDLQRNVGNRSAQRMIAKSAPDLAGTSPPQVTGSGGVQLPRTSANSWNHDSRRTSVMCASIPTTKLQTPPSSLVPMPIRAAATISHRDSIAEEPGWTALARRRVDDVVEQEGNGRRPSIRREVKLTYSPTSPSARQKRRPTWTERGERAPEIALAGKGIQRDVGWAQRGPLPEPYRTLLHCQMCLPPSFSRPPS